MWPGRSADSKCGSHSCRGQRSQNNTCRSCSRRSETSRRSPCIARCPRNAGSRGTTGSRRNETTRCRCRSSNSSGIGSDPWSRRRTCTRCSARSARTRRSRRWLARFCRRSRACEARLRTREQSRGAELPSWSVRHFGEGRVASLQGRVKRNAELLATSGHCGPMCDMEAHRMFRPNTSILSASLTALVLSLTPSAAHASPKHATRSSRVARVVAPRPCSKRPVEVVAGKESATFALAKCDGSADPDGVDQLSLLARPAGTSKPKESLTALTKSRGPELAPGILRVDPRLVERLELVADQFRKAGEHEHIVLGSVAGRSEPGSHPGMVRSLDFRIGG